MNLCYGLYRAIYGLMSVSLEVRPALLADLTEHLTASFDLRHMMTIWLARYHRIPLQSAIGHRAVAG